MENSLNHMLDGQAIDPEIAKCCDFTLAEQNAAAEAQGVAPSAPSDYVPKLGDTVTYIVACVLVNDKNEVLMMQEAKQSCAGKWYLPAGRMEKGELIIEAAVRETLEETGMHCDVKTLITIECAGGSWFRFAFTGKVTGGELKVPAKADQESLQAKWILNIDELSLRSKDIMHLIDRGRAYHEAKLLKNVFWHTDTLPSKLEHNKNLLRLVIIIKKRATNRVNVLLSEKTMLHFPTTEIHPARNVHSTLRRFMVEIFGAELPQHRPHGLISVEHNPFDSKNDGFCMTLLVTFRSPLEEVPIIGKCIWHEVSKELGDKLLKRVSSKNASVLLHVIR
ncbi:8-oxo-dGDP phosphatase NUDT18-like [Ctenocephalides felis]|uniref:8-oxo-dGDP phosphatase NUDT18-like n=1 Tax=Ctenocephalides felis TaxID=7515 RepID=UPI000E6E1F20|nr:8-oxo-dGDP phosphatase NUDT18-like [Ctenocephalides felis]XP_026466939.1 8-oxo-dGDP phosphatase NUDT18-like [Ctenocephalides felis]